MNGESGEKKNSKIYNTPATSIKILRIVIFLTKFSDMSNLFDVANKNVRSDVEKNKTKDFGLLLKQGRVTISIKALTKVDFFPRTGRGMKKGSVFMEMQ